MSIIKNLSPLLKLGDSISDPMKCWAPIPLRVIVGYGFMAHGYAKLMKGPDVFVGIVHALGVPAPHLMAWLTIMVELLGGFAVLLGAFVLLVSLPMAVVLLVAIFTVHLPYGFTSIKLMAVTAAGPQFGPPGYETDLLYLACLAALIIGGSGPFAVDSFIVSRVRRTELRRPASRSLLQLPRLDRADYLSLKMRSAKFFSALNGNYAFAPRERLLWPEAVDQLRPHLGTSHPDCLGLISLLCGAQATCQQSQSASPTWPRRIVNFMVPPRGCVPGEERMKDVKVLAFDTGGTVLDWHSGLTAAMASWGAAHHIKCDWHALANEHRHRSLRRMTSTVDPAFNIDEVHRDVLGELFDENELGGSVKERWVIAQRWHELEAWPDFAGALRRLRRRRICVSFTILSLPLIVDVSRHNGIDWDAVIPCEMLRVYKPLPEAYRRAAKLLAVERNEILMVACHNFDLDAARGEGYRTAFVRRPNEWGPGGPPDPVPNSACDLVVDGFAELADVFEA